MRVSVSAGQLVDEARRPLQLRGVNVSGLEFVAAHGWNDQDPWNGARPDCRAIAAWGANALRVPLNPQSWLGINGCDPGNNYRTAVHQVVADAHAAGLYVVLDLHVSAPGAAKALGQQPMALADHDLAFWSSLASTFKGDPAVIFELYNEPFDDWWNGDPVAGIYHGGVTVNRYATELDSNETKLGTFKVASMAALLAAVRSTGATNVVLVGGHDWCNDLTDWLANRPSDPLGQMGCAWHSYPVQLHSYPRDATSVPTIQAAGFPVLLTESGDHNATGTVGAPYISTLLPWLDSLGVGYLLWTWDAWPVDEKPDFVLIKDRSGTPTDGYGQYVKQHFLERTGTVTDDLVGLLDQLAEPAPEELAQLCDEGGVPAQFRLEPREVAESSCSMRSYSTAAPKAHTAATSVARLLGEVAVQLSEELLVLGRHGASLRPGTLQV